MAPGAGGAPEPPGAQGRPALPAAAGEAGPARVRGTGVLIADIIALDTRKARGRRQKATLRGAAQARPLRLRRELAQPICQWTGRCRPTGS